VLQRELRGGFFPLVSLFSLLLHLPAPLKHHSALSALLYNTLAHNVLPLFCLRTQLPQLLLPPLPDILRARRRSRHIPRIPPPPLPMHAKALRVRRVVMETV